MDSNFVAVGSLNQMRDYKEEYIKTLEALVELQQELIDTLKNRPTPIVISAPAQPTVNPFVPYQPYIGPYATNPTTICGTNQAHSNVQCYNTVGMGPEFAG